jgi:hypothetical protein
MQKGEYVQQSTDASGVPVKVVEPEVLVEIGRLVCGQLT